MSNVLYKDMSEDDACTIFSAVLKHRSVLKEEGLASPSAKNPDLTWEDVVAPVRSPTEGDDVVIPFDCAVVMMEAVENKAWYTDTDPWDRKECTRVGRELKNLLEESAA